METATEVSVLDGLPAKRRAFVEYFIGISNGNATDAARRAGYAKPMQEGHRLLSFADIKAAVSERYRTAAMGADEALTRLAAIARATFADGLEEVEVPAGNDEDGKPITRTMRRLSIDKMVETGLIHQVSEISHSEYGPRVKLSDPQSALEKIARAHGLFAGDTSKLEVVVKVYEGVDVSEAV